MNGTDEFDSTATSGLNAGNSIVEVETSASLPIQKEMSSDIDASMAAMDLSQDEDGSRSSSPSFAKEDHEFQIKDVTDYSRNSPVEIEPSSSSEGLLRGWSQEEENDDGDIDEDEDDVMNKEKALKALKKGAVAVTGAALVVAGIPLIPMPTPGGVIVSGSGLALLATEFPAAQRVLDKSRDGLEKMVGEEGDDDDDTTDDEDDNKFSTRKKKGYSKIVTQQEDNNDAGFVGEECEEASLVSVRSVNTRERMDEIIKTTKKAGKRTKKNVKSFVRGTVLPLMSKITTDKGEGSESEPSTSISPTKRTGFLRRKNSPKNSPQKDNGKNASVAVKIDGKKQSPKPLRIKNDDDVPSRDKSSTSFPVTLPELTSNPIENEGTVTEIK